MSRAHEFPSDDPRVARRREALARFAGLRDGVRTVISPYRVCPLGAHLDHQHGPVLGMAIGLGTRLAFAPSPDGSVRLERSDFAGEARFSLAQPGTDRGWQRYARGAAAALRERLPEQPCGLVGSLAGDLPGGGLSSSASVLIAYLLALAARERRRAATSGARAARAPGGERVRGREQRRARPRHDRRRGARSAARDRHARRRLARALQQSLLATPGVLGARFSGAGYGGCNVALVRAERAERALDLALAAYRAAMPGQAGPARGFLVDPSDGARVV
jgi:galactokinase